MEHSKGDTILILLPLMSIIIVLISTQIYDNSKQNKTIENNYNNTKIINNTNKEIIKQNFYNTIQENKTCNCECISLATSCPKCEKNNFFEIIKTPSNIINYEKGVYDCSDMTEVGHELLTQVGYKDVEYVHIKERNHQILRIDGPIYIEETTGRVILPIEYKEFDI